MRTRGFLSAALLLNLILASCAARKPGSPIQPGFNLFSKEQDIELGREAAAQIRTQIEGVDHPALQNYVTTLGSRLAHQPEAGDYPYSFTLINDPSINAFALPGGPVFVNSGLIANADNEAQVAGVLAHEISHVALRHATNQASKANLIQLPAVLAGTAIGQGSLLAQLGQLGLGLGFNSILLRYSRDAERQADALGARIMNNASYDPIEMATFFEKLEAEGGSRAPEFLSSHPSPGNRIKAVQAEMTALPRRPYTANTGQFDQAKALVAQLPPPRRRPQQATPAQAPQPAAGGGFRQLQARNLVVSVPEGWEAFGDRNSSMLTIAPRQGLVQNQFGGIDVGYGAILSYYFPASRDSNLQHATDEMLHDLQAANPAMQISGRARRVRVGGRPGLITTLTSASPYGGQEIDAVLTVACPEGLFYMVFISPERSWKQLEGAFNEMVRSIQFQ